MTTVPILNTVTIFSFWFDQTGNRIQVYRFTDRLFFRGRLKNIETQIIPCTSLQVHKNRKKKEKKM